MTLDITQFYQTFFDEADELLAQMEQCLLDLNLDDPDPEDLGAIFRAVHSIKGGAATFGFAALTDTTHILESLLDRARNHDLVLRREMIDIFLETKDVLSAQLSDYRAGSEPDAAAAQAICAMLEHLNAQEPSVAEVAAVIPAAGHTAGHTAETAAAWPPAHVLTQALNVVQGQAADADAQALNTPVAPAINGAHLKITLRGVAAKDQELLVDELGNLGRVAGQVSTGADLTLWLETDVAPDDIVAVCCFVIDEEQIVIDRGVQPEPHTTPEIEQTSAEIQFEPEIAAALNASAELQAELQTEAQEQTQAQTAAEAAPVAAATPNNPRKPRTASGTGAATEGSSIRVGVEKVDQLINLVGELVITQAMLAQTASTLDPALNDRLFNGMAQLERNARDLQEAVMSIRMMPMDYVFSRFPRLVRDLAAKLGKDVELVTFGQATELDKSLIERIIDPLTHLVRNSLDHGIETVAARLAAGKDATGQLVLSAAHHGGNIVIEVSDDGAGLHRERILAKARKQGMALSETMSDDEVWSLIFMPGFSTADQVTDISGRGVGMDVVKRNIQAMGGHVEITSRAGHGTTTRIVLPLTLAILDGMSVKVGAEIFILPLNFVMESLQPLAQDIYTVANNDRVVRVRGEYLPLVPLHEVFAVEGARADPTQGIVTILQAEGRRFAMLVDELVGQQQVVVKNLETNYRKVHGISAATILGDGSVALIVDVAGLNRETRALHGAALNFA
ncbi:chemotaxis protein CheA [Paraburkholderia bonniea]|uniref:chemotaxis protein CheA n=1 Tax=Paraburkholderia bonniea TaxID=2152891 RepID=UPI001291775C|nr:chemotaxis protein CheA [Paraburkholderia bonniea]